MGKNCKCCRSQAGGVQGEKGTSQGPEAVAGGVYSLELRECRRPNQFDPSTESCRMAVGADGGSCAIGDAGPEEPG